VLVICLASFSALFMKAEHPPKRQKITISQIPEDSTFGLIAPVILNDESDKE
jgi:hypothetical protein